MLNSFRKKITWIISLLLACSVGLCLFVSLKVVSSSQEAGIKKSFERNADIINAFTEINRATLLSQSSMLGILPIIVTVVENGDPSTITNTAQSYHKDLKLGVLDTWNSDGEFLAGATVSEEAESEELENLVNDTIEGEEGLTTLMVRDQKINLISSGIIGTPDDASGVILLGKHLDDAIAKEMARLTGADISFYSGNTLYATSKKEDQRKALTETLKTLKFPQANATVEKNGYLFRYQPLFDHKKREIGRILIQISAAEVRAMQDQLLMTLGGFGLAILGIAIVLSFWISIKLCAPIVTQASALKESVDASQSISHHLKDVSQDLAEFIGIGQSNTSETSNAMVEMEGAISKTSNITNQAYQNSETISNQTRELGESMSTLSSSIDRLEQANLQIRQINQIFEDIKQESLLITSIVKKTELVAINSYIEAARAGKHGKSFIVIAEEVGKLAAHSGDIAKKIYSKLENSQTEAAKMINTIDSSVSTNKAATEESIEEIKGITDKLVNIIKNISEIRDNSIYQNKSVTNTKNNLAKVVDIYDKQKSIAQVVKESSDNITEQSEKLHSIGNNINDIVFGRRAS